MPSDAVRTEQKPVTSGLSEWDSVRRTVLCTLAAVALVTGCGKPKQAARSMLTVQTATISDATFEPNIQAISMLESTTTVALMPETEGRVVQVLAKEGQPVKAGQPILVLDNVQESAALDAAKAQALTDRLNAERYEFLFQNGATSAELRDQYATQAITSRDQARTAAANLGYKFVRSPIDGVIGNLDKVKLGDYIEAGQNITGIVNNSNLWTLMEIPATHAGQVAIGQTVKVVSQGDPPVQGEGSVVFISPYFGTSSNSSAPNTVLVKAEFPNLTGQLKTGQFVKSAIITGSKQTLAVPVQAVMMQAEQPFVYKLIPLSRALPGIKASANVPEATKKTLEKLPPTTPIVVQTKVELGQLQNNFYPVQSGLNRADRVAVSNTSQLRSGMPVKVAPANASQRTVPTKTTKD